jgi:hypothetical protein
MPPEPKAKAKQWEKADKKYLFDLVRIGDIDITNTLYKIIEDVQKTFFDHRDVKNFRRNFCNFVASLGLKTK